MAKASKPTKPNQLKQPPEGRPARKAQATRAVRALEAAAVPYRLERFDPASAAPGEGYARAAARALGVDPASVFKTLMVLVDDRLWCAVVPASGELDLKAMARAADGKRATMASVLQAERATGYVVGGISPLGQRRPHATVIDASAMSQAEILISAGARGLDAALAPGDLARLTRARVDCIGRAA